MDSWKVSWQTQVDAYCKVSLAWRWKFCWHQTTHNCFNNCYWFLFRSQRILCNLITRWNISFCKRKPTSITFKSLGINHDISRSVLYFKTWIQNIKHFANAKQRFLHFWHWRFWHRCNNVKHSNACEATRLLRPYWQLFILSSNLGSWRMYLEICAKFLDCVI